MVVIKSRLSRGEIILDCSARPRVTTRILIRGRKEGQRQRESEKESGDGSRVRET